MESSLPFVGRDSWITNQLRDSGFYNYFYKFAAKAGTAIRPICISVCIKYNQKVDNTPQEISNKRVLKLRQSIVAFLAVNSLASPALRNRTRSVIHSNKFGSITYCFHSNSVANLRDTTTKTPIALHCPKDDGGGKPFQLIDSIRRRTDCVVYFIRWGKLISLIATPGAVC